MTLNKKLKTLQDILNEVNKIIAEDKEHLLLNAIVKNYSSYPIYFSTEKITGESGKKYPLLKKNIKVFQIYDIGQYSISDKNTDKNTCVSETLSQNSEKKSSSKIFIHILKGQKEVKSVLNLKNLEKYLNLKIYTSCLDKEIVFNGLYSFSELIIDRINKEILLK